MTVQARLAHPSLFQKLRVKLISRKLDRFCEANTEMANLVDKFNVGFERDLFEAGVLLAVTAVIIGRVYDVLRVHVLLIILRISGFSHFFSCDGANAADFKRKQALDILNRHLCLNNNLDGEVFGKVT